MGILLYPHAVYISSSSQLHFHVEAFSKSFGARRLIAFSLHSNSRILKSNQRSSYGQPLSPYENCHDRGYDGEFHGGGGGGGGGGGEEDDDDDDEEEEEEEEDEEEESYMSADDEFAELEVFNHNQHKQKASNFLPYEGLVRKQGTSQVSNGLHMGKPSESGNNHGTYRSLGIKHGIKSRYSQDGHLSRGKCDEMGSENLDSRGKVKSRGLMRSSLRRLSEDLDFGEKWFPLIEYLTTFGLKECHIIQIYERHMPCLQISIASAQERLEFLLNIGVKHGDVKKILMRQPQILEYTVEKNLKSHVAFLVSLGVPDSRIGQIITAAPSLFSYSVEHSLKPTIRYLIEEVGIKESDVRKVVQLSPQILVQRIDTSWKTRFSFLSKELGAPRDSIVKMVTKHPQLLHYSIEDGILPRINFLRSIGMRNSEILKILTSLTQVLSLSLEDNLRPKYLYLVNELHNDVQSLTKYPMYLSLSLDQRIRPRHRFLVSLKKAPKGPFPLSSLVPTDECFCRHWAGTSIERYQAFRQTLLLSKFAKKYGRDK